MNPHLVLGFDALAVAVAAAVVDVRQHRIPNWLTYSGIAMGIVLRCFFYGWRGLGSALGAACLRAASCFCFTWYALWGRAT